MEVFLGAKQTDGCTASILGPGADRGQRAATRQAKGGIQYAKLGRVLIFVLISPAQSMATRGMRRLQLPK
jgi:hypothetical protein